MLGRDLQNQFRQLFENLSESERKSLAVLESLLGQLHPSDVLTVENTKPIVNFFANRWKQLIKDRNFNKAYPYTAHEPVNNLLIALAKTLNEHVVKKSYLQILMPTFRDDHLVCISTFEHVDTVPLERLVLSDDVSRLIDIYETFKMAVEDGKFKHTFISGQTEYLSKNEVARVIYHSEETITAYLHFAKYIDQMRNDSSFDGALSRLEYLVVNGAIRYKNDEEREKFAGEDAYKGIEEFEKWLSILTPTEQDKLFALTAPDLNQDHMLDNERFESFENLGEVWTTVSPSERQKFLNKEWFQRLKTTYANPNPLSDQEFEKLLIDLEQNQPAEYQELTFKAKYYTEEEYKKIWLDGRYCMKHLGEKIHRIRTANPQLKTTYPIHSNHDINIKYFGETNKALKADVIAAISPLENPPERANKPSLIERDLHVNVLFKKPIEKRLEMMVFLRDSFAQIAQPGWDLISILSPLLLNDRYAFLNQPAIAIKIPKLINDAYFFSHLVSLLRNKRRHDITSIKGLKRAMHRVDEMMVGHLRFKDVYKNLYANLKIAYNNTYLSLMQNRSSPFSLFNKSAKIAAFQAKAQSHKISVRMGHL